MNFTRGASSIQILLPITTPTGKVRVKRPVAGQISQPVACRSVPMCAEDYLEWQISYDTESLNDPSALREIELHKSQGVRYACELIRLIVEAHKITLLDSASLERMKNLVFSPMERGVEESEPIRREPDSPASSPLQDRDFVRFKLLTPVYVKTMPLYAVEIRIKEKQRAVGSQAMIYVHIPVSACASTTGAPLSGRCAEKGEQAQYTLKSENISLLEDTVSAFAFASQSHRRDLRMIFDQL